MSKYEKGFGGLEASIENVILEDESVIWSGKPKKSAFIINKSLTMLPIALVWLAFDVGIISIMFASGMPSEFVAFAVPFFLLHLAPVWIWLAGALTASKKWKNTQYAVTDKRIIIQTGFVGMEYASIYYKEITDVQLKVGIIDKMLGVGDIYFTMNSVTIANKSTSVRAQAFFDIENAYELYAKVQKIVLDIQTDMHYPNNLRPARNDGYKTKYKG